MAFINNRFFQMRVPDDFMRRLDAWRRRQPDIPSRSESVRRLVEAGMGALGGSPKPSATRTRSKP
jgi:hypothetical protein